MPSRPRDVLLVGIGAAATGPFAAGYLLPQAGYLGIGLASFAGYSPYALGVVVLLAWALRRWAVTAVLSVVLLAQVATLGPAYVRDGPRDGTALVAMTANLYFGRVDPAVVVRAVRDHRVDVLGVEELTPEAVAGLRAAGLERLLPHASLRPGRTALGAGVWSRTPLTPVPPWPSTFFGAAGDLDIGGTTVRVRVLHPPPPVRGRGVGVWSRDYDRFLAAARVETSGPTVLLGDFNAALHHRRLRRLMGDRWSDAGEVAGAGLVRTWGPRADRPKLLDPDHVLVDRGMGVRRFATIDLGVGDHRAVVATVLLPTRP